MNNATCCPGWCARADALLDVPGIHVIAVENTAREQIITVETDQSLTGCPVCGVVAIGHGRRIVRLHDTPAHGRPVRLDWAKRIWRCADPHCPAGTFTETHELAPAKAKLTTRAITWATDALSRFDTSVSALAYQLGVSWHTLWKPVKTEAERRTSTDDRLVGVDALGVDEHVWVHTGFPGSGMVTGIIDPTRDANGVVHARLLDLVEGRSGKTYADWLKAQSPEFRAGIKVATLDPFRGYANAIRDELPDAIQVLDAFHVVKLASTMVDDVRRRVQQDILGHRGRKGDPLFQIRRSLQIGAEHLSKKQIDRLNEKLEAGDPKHEVTLAWQCYQQVRAIYHAPPEKGRELVAKTLTSFPSCPIPEIARLGRTLKSWREEILAYFKTQGASNGPTEAVNGVIETTRRIARGFAELLKLQIAQSAQCRRPPPVPDQTHQPCLTTKSPISFVTGLLRYVSQLTMATPIHPESFKT